jgi:hypothetical protein
MMKALPLAAVIFASCAPALGEVDEPFREVYRIGHQMCVAFRGCVLPTRTSLRPVVDPGIALVQIDLESGAMRCLLSTGIFPDGGRGGGSRLTRVLGVDHDDSTVAILLMASKVVEGGFGVTFLPDEQPSFSVQYFSLKDGKQVQSVEVVVGAEVDTNKDRVDSKIFGLEESGFRIGDRRFALEKGVPIEVASE